MAQLLEKNVSALDQLRLQAMLETIRPEQAAQALQLLEDQLSSEARARSEKACSVRCHLLGEWSKIDSLAALENLVTRFDPQRIQELPERSGLLHGSWGDTAAPCFRRFCAKDKAAAIQWFINATRAGRFDAPVREFTLVYSLLSEISSRWDNADPAVGQMVIDCNLEWLNRGLDSGLQCSILTGQGSVRMLPYLELILASLDRLHSASQRKEFRQRVEENRTSLWIQSDFPRARTWFESQDEVMQKKWFSALVFPGYEPHPADEQGSDWTPYMDWALKTMPAECTEAKLPGLMSQWFGHDVERAATWLCTHTGKAGPLKAALDSVVRLLDDRNDICHSKTFEAHKAKYENLRDRTLSAALELAGAWQQRDPAAARAEGPALLRRIQNWPSLSQPILNVLQP